MNNFTPLNGSPELQEEAVKQIANLPESPLYELRIEWEKDVYLVIANEPSSLSLIRINVIYGQPCNEWIRYITISREMLKGVALEFVKQTIQDDIDYIKKSAE